MADSNTATIFLAVILREYCSISASGIIVFPDLNASHSASTYSAIPAESIQSKILPLGSDLLLHPARGEAAGTAPLEALYAGVPVLASSSGGWAREIVEADSMLIPAPFRQVTFNRALRLLLSTPSKLEEMTREAIAIGTEMDVERRFEVAADIITGKHSK